MTRSGVAIWLIAAACLLLPRAAVAQVGPDLVPESARAEAARALLTPSVAPDGSVEDVAGVNPLQMLADAAAALPSGPSTGGEERPGLSVALNIMILLTVITLVPSIMVMTTSFVRILIVLALLRQALGAQQLPPPQVITGLALFMTLMVMQPTIDRVWDDAVVPYQNGEIRDYDELWSKARQPIRDYMFDQIEATNNWSSLYMILNYRGVDTSDPGSLVRADISTATLIPAYMLSELKIAFLMGFRVYLPFLVIDMVIASLLISMSMMMLPPVMISLPFKLMLFILVDGWSLVVGSLLESFVTDPGAAGRLSAQPAEAALLLLPLLVCRPAGRPASEGRNLQCRTTKPRCSWSATR